MKLGLVSKLWGFLQWIGPMRLGILLLAKGVINISQWYWWRSDRFERFDLSVLLGDNTISRTMPSGLKSNYSLPVERIDRIFLGSVLVHSVSGHFYLNITILDEKGLRFYGRTLWNLRYWFWEVPISGSAQRIWCWGFWHLSSKERKSMQETIHQRRT